MLDRLYFTVALVAVVIIVVYFLTR